MPSAAVAQQVLELINTAYADQTEESEVEIPFVSFTQDSLRQTIEDETLAVANLGRGLDRARQRLCPFGRISSGNVERPGKSQGKPSFV